MGGGGGMPWTPLEKFPPLALIQILAPSGSLRLGTPLNLQRAYNLESMSIWEILHFHSNPAFPQNVSDYDRRVIDIQFKNAQIMFKTTFSFEVAYLIASCW